MKVQHLISSLAASFHCLHIPVHELYFPIFGLTLGKISIFLLSLHFFIVIIWLNLVNTLAFYLKRFRRQRTLGYNEQIFCIKIRQQIWKVQLQRTPICYTVFLLQHFARFNFIQRAFNLWMLCFPGESARGRWRRYDRRLSDERSQNYDENPVDGSNGRRSRGET